MPVFMTSKCYKAILDFTNKLVKINKTKEN